MSSRAKRKRRNTYADQGKMVLRMVSVRADTANEEQRAIDVVIATETPVMRFDPARGEAVSEILLMDGVEFRSSNRQLPIVDTHDRSTVRNVYGSVQNIVAENGELVGRAVFARDQDSQDAFHKVRDGHLTDFSITAGVNEVVEVQRGEDFTMTTGEKITGPADVVTRWVPTDASLAAAGADPNSTVRSLMRSYEVLTPETEETEMVISAEKMKALRESGLPEDITEVDAILDWALANPVATSDPEEPADDTTETEPTEAEPVETEAPEAVTARALKAERTRTKEIRAICQQAGIERADEQTYLDNGATVAEVQRKAIKIMADRNDPAGTTVKTGTDGIQRLHDDMRDGLIRRAVTATGAKNFDPFKGKTPSEGADNFQHMGLMRMAERSLQSGGISTDRMSARDIAMVALGHRGTIDRLNIRRDGEAYHVTGTFSNLLQDAANKTLLAGYDEAPYTWMTWARQAASVQDFKSIKRNRFSEAPNLELVPENKDYPEGAMSDDKETYKVEKYGQIFSVTWETVVNDDLDAISRVPAMHGNAARRKQNQLVYSILTANAAMADTGTLFNTTAQTTAGGHANQASSGGAISVATLNTAFVSMMTKKGLNSSVTINVQPSFLIVPAAVAATALQVVGSIADPTSTSNTADFNSGTTNIYGPNGPRPLRVVVDPELDADSATKWYLAASPAQIDTVELSFLQGEETPVLETEWDFNKDVYKYKIRQTFGAAPIDFRGLYYNPGA